MKPLATLLYDLDVPISQEPVDGFPRSQCIQLAFRIVEWGLLLSGTTWFSKLDSRVVQRSKMGEDNWNQFFLETQASNNDFDSNDSKKLEQYIFAIGILILEIGTERLVSNIRPRSTDFLIYKPGTDPKTEPFQVTEAEIHHRLTVSIGDRYASTVSQCLARKKSKCWRIIWCATSQAREAASIYGSYGGVLSFNIQAVSICICLLEEIAR
jgi:hypothetical protein